MRLLQCTSAGQLSLTKILVSDDIPKYAILSHTWGADTEEITFRDLMDDTSKSKAGYEKILFCGERARRDGLEYFWVDTCCIDKSSSAELAEAINSMFKWYSRAVKCYAYLSDVQVPEHDDRQLIWETAFRNSRWFTRGWTLQELIAPVSVEFFSFNGKRLGDRRSLAQEIHEITGIASGVLQGVSLNTFSVDERFSWAAKRQTTRKEDKAYCLLGIFGVYLPPIYGEGDNAFNRLKVEITKTSIDSRPISLPYAQDASFNSLARQHDPTCLENTRVDILNKIYQWADREDKQCIFWLNGLAGTGKSTIARTVAPTYFDQKRLAASFFFSRGGGDVGHANKFFTSLAVQLAQNIPQTRRFIADAIIEQDKIANQSLHDQWHQLVLGPLSKLDSRSSYVLIVDALDECDNEDDIRMILRLLSKARTLETVRLRIFFTSRPETPIRHGFYQIPDSEHQDFVLHSISPSIVNHDISIFLQYSLKIIASERSLGTSWPGEQIIKHLIYNASGLFIWAATACRFIRQGRQFATKRLHMILESGSTTVNAPEKHLNEIYLTVLQHSVSPDYTAEEADIFCYTLKSLLGSIVALFSPLSTQSLSKLVNIPHNEVDQTLDDLHAILDISQDLSCPLRLHHPSFRDFLLNKERCVDSNFQVDEKQAHQMLAGCCIQLMSTTLKQDICGQDAPGILVANIERSQIEFCLPPEVKYACLYWVQHLQKSVTQLYDNDQVHQFLQVHLLHWLEALGWIGKISEGILAISSLEVLILADKSPNLHAFIRDAKRFVLYSQSVIGQAPLQVYISALIFSPEMSIIRGKFKEQIPSSIKRLPRVQNLWSSLLQTLEGHSGTVFSVAFSLDGRLVASGSDDGTVRLWEAATGKERHMLKGHSKRVCSVVFSPDSQLIVSGSDDGTVRLWNVITGAEQYVFEYHSDSIGSVAFSLDGQLAVSGRGSIVRIWNTVTREQYILEGHSDPVFSVAFSPDGRLVASGSFSGTVRLWNVATRVLQHTLKSNSVWVNSVAISPNGQLAVVASFSLEVWDIATGTLQYTLKSNAGSINSAAFSPDGQIVVLGLNNGTIRLLNAATGEKRYILEGHPGIVCSVAFSPDGQLVASGSEDRTVRLWDTTKGAVQQAQHTLESYSNWVELVAFSPDGQLVVSVHDSIVQLWDTATGEKRRTFKGHSYSVRSVAFSLDSKLIAAGSDDSTVRLWDTTTGVIRHTLKDHLGGDISVAFSPNSQLVASGSSRSNGITVLLWDTATGKMRHKLESHLNYITSVAFSPDSKMIASGSYDSTVRLWNTTTGALQHTLKGNSDLIYSVAFSPDGRLVTSGSGYDNRGTVRLWNAATGEKLYTLDFDSEIRSVSFSPLGQYLKTERRTIDVNSILPNLSSCSSESLPPLFIQDGWIFVESKPYIWLPSDYRPSHLVVWNRIIVLGCSSEGISFLEV